MSFLDQYRPHMERLGANAESKYHHICRLLGEIRDAVQDSSDDPTLTDIYNRQSAVQLNGTKSFGKVPVGEIWILDYVSASVAGWTLTNGAYVVLWSVASASQVPNTGPVFLPGDEPTLVTTAPTDAIVQFTRKPIERKPPYRARTGMSDERPTRGTGAYHERARDIIDAPPAHPAGVPSVA